MNYEVSYTEEAQKMFGALSSKVQRQVAAKVRSLAAGHLGNLVALKGAINLYRIRSGDFRIIFKMEGANVVIVAIRDRKEAY